MLSVQVLQEFYVTVTRKLKKPLRAGEALDIVREYLTWTVVENTGGLLIEAAELQQSAQLSFWDALGRCDLTVPSWLSARRPALRSTNRTPSDLAPGRPRSRAA